jgi:Ca2+-binding EF-hand superfamily protein
MKALVCDHCGEVLDTQTIEALPKKFYLGDADGNEEIDINDATFILRYLAKIDTPFTKEELMRGDADGSGDLELPDVTAIQYYLANMKTPYNIGELV